MAKRHERGCGRTYHSFVALLLILAGGGLAGYGIYRRVKNNDGPFSLDYETSELAELDNIWAWVVRLNLSAIVIGSFLVVAGIAALISFTRKCIGGVFRIVYFLIAVVIVIAMLGLSGVSWYLFANNDDNGLIDFVENAWENTVKNDPSDICSVEADFKCRGFRDDDCERCPTGVGSSCTPAARLRCAPCTKGSTEFVGNGCWNEFQSRFRRFYIIVGVVGAVIAGVMLVDMCVLCSL